TAQPRRVDELDERPVSQRDRAVALERLERALDLRGCGGVGEAVRPARREAGVGDAIRPERMPEEGADGRELAADRRGRELSWPAAVPRAAQPRDVVGEHADVDSVELRAALLEPGTKLFHVAAIRTARAVAQRRRGEEAVGCGTCVHSGRFPGYGPFPFR